MQVGAGVRGGIAVLLAGVAVAVGCALAAAPVFAVGDANKASCAAATESSPGFRAWLPDCRAYEIVSESNSGDTANVVGSFGFPEGVHVYYKGFLPTPGARARDGLNERFLATRSSSGWTQQAVSPPQGEGPLHLELAAQENAEGVVFTGDFAEAFVNSPFRDPSEEPQLNQSTGMGVYRLSLDSGAVTMMSLPDSGVLTQEMLEGSGAYKTFAEVNDWGSFMAGGSVDGGRAFFVTTAKLATAQGTPQDTHEQGNEIYERTDGHTYLVGVLPDGEVPACGAEVGQRIKTTIENNAFYSYGAIAPSGTNVVFSASNCSEGGLFLRDVVDGTTVRLPGSIYGGRAGTGAGEEEVVLTSGKGRFYEYHVTSGQTVEFGEGASGLLAYSADGSRVYLLGNEQGLYVYHDGETKLVAGTNAGGYEAGVIGGGSVKGSEATEYALTRNMPVASAGESDGSHLLFIDSAQLTQYKNERHFEAFVYDAGTDSVTCISCSPRNEPPVGEVGGLVEGRAQLIDEFSTDTGEQQYQTPSPPFISSDGSRAVFESNEALVPQDVNGTMDVYEWEREGTEGCSTESLHVESLAESAAYSPVDGGCVYLLSSGLGKEIPNPEHIANGTHLVGASENLEDVYIQTSESLLPGLDNASKLYDVRIDGGFPYRPPSHGCEATQCELSAGEPAMPAESTSEAFAGPGDVKSVVRRAKSSAGPVRRRKLARALNACRRRRGRRSRIACERRARQRFGARTSGVRGGRGGGSR